ncbi:flagellar motor protein MotB [Teredinibacter haidensis]|uniref:flagellar motor protein MotB n=1 Tax=Teredinibacter haidensis TaxID=2731755 RepID=UPI000948F3FC|nr:flagellar motor protein MotB [Teredinibacter haidensis]
MRRRNPIETKINHERWLVSYSDFVTLLFAFFVVMYSVSQVNENKYRILSSTLQSAFSSQAGQPVDAQQQTELVSLDSLEAELETLLEKMIIDGSVSVWGNEDWVELEINANLLFNSGSADPSAEAKQIFADVADVLAPFQNAVAVSGHTDNIPIRTERYQSNWQLSSARAVAIVNLLAYTGVDPTRLSATGYGEYQPVDDNSTAQGRAKNRRVVLRVARSKAETPREGAARVMAESGEAILPDMEEQVQPLAPDAMEEPQGGLQENVIEPIKLPNGGLLFTSDPKGRG